MCICLALPLKNETVLLENYSCNLYIIKKHASESKKKYEKKAKWKKHR